jgi:predicted aspartyl protease
LKRAALLCLTAALALCLPAVAAQGNAPAKDPLAEARRLLAEDSFEEALAGARRLVEERPEVAEAHVLLGDALYRRGDFDEAEAAYRRAVEIDPDCAAGQFGMGRIFRTLGRYGEAAASFHRAAALAPENARYIRILSNHLARREDVIAMMEQYLEMPEAEEERIRKNVAAWVELLKFLGDEPLREVIRSEPTELPVNVLKGQAYFKAKVNKLKGQRFAFDTGATGMTVSPRLAKRAKLKKIRPFDIVGMGGKGTVSGDLVLIRELSVGGITLRNVAATVAEPKGGPEEGLIGPPLFSAFAIRIDLKGGTIALQPVKAGAGTGEGRTGIPFRNVGGQIVVPASLNGTTLNAMVDTGSNSSLSSFSAVPRVPGLELLSAAMSKGRSSGLGGQMSRRTIREATLSFAGEEFKADGMPCVDLSAFSRALESEIYLVIGSPELERFILEIDYRTNSLYLEAVAR